MAVGGGGGGDRPSRRSPSPPRPRPRAAARSSSSATSPGRRLAAQARPRPPTPGLHEYLRWEAEPQEILQPVVLAGPATASADRARSSASAAGARRAKPRPCSGLQSFGHMVEKLRAAYELAILLAPRRSRPNRRRPWRSPAGRCGPRGAARGRGSRPRTLRCASAIGRLPAARPGGGGSGDAELGSEVVAGEVGVEPLGVLAARAAAGPGAGCRPTRRGASAGRRRASATAAIRKATIGTT